MTHRPPFEMRRTNVEDDDDGGGDPRALVKSPPRAVARTATGREPDVAPRKEHGRRHGRDASDCSGASALSFETPEGGAAGAAPRGPTREEEEEDDGTAAPDLSFPALDSSVEICGGCYPDEDEDDEGGEETPEDRARRELAESEALARQLMAEEAMASYAMGTEYLREHANQFSDEDLAALQAAMAEEDPEGGEDPHDPFSEGDINSNDVLLREEDDGEDDSRELSYDALLRLGERIGDVKAERWARVSAAEIRRHCGPASTFAFTPSLAAGKAENHTEVKCQVCQFPYEEGDALRRLPCGHCFHVDCIDAWLAVKDTCALCRKSIVPDDAGDPWDEE